MARMIPSRANLMNVSQPRRNTGHRHSKSFLYKM